MNHFRLRLLLCLAAAVLTGCGDPPEALLASAKDYLARNEPQAAVIQLKNALQKQPDLAEARFLLGKTLLESGDFPGAEKELARAAALNYDQEQVTPLWARALVLTGEHEKVTDELAKVEVSNPRGKAELMTAVGEAHMAKRNIPAAREAFSAARSADATYVPPLLGEAQIAAISRDLKEANTKVDAALAIEARNWRALELKGDLLEAGKQRDRALTYYRQAVEANPGALHAHAAIVSALMQQRKLEEAAKQVAELKQAAPRNPQTQYLEAWLAYEQKDFAAARRAIQQHLAAAPDNLRALLLAGAIEYQLQSYVQAEEYLSKVLARAPNQTFAWSLLIDSYVRRGQAGRALEKLQPVLHQIQKQNDPRMLQLAGEVLMLNGDAKQAEDYFAKAAKLDPQNARNRTSLALTHMAQGDSTTALRELEQAAASGSDARADAVLIAAHVRQREFEKALAAVDRLQKKLPGSPVPHSIRGGVLLAKGDRAAARKELQRALEINPGFFPAAAQLAQLDLAENKPDAARERFESVLAKDPRNLSAMVAIAELRARAGAKPEEVVGLLSKAISTHPNVPAARLSLIAYQIRTKDFKNAMLSAQQAMAAIPDNPQVLAAAAQAHQVAGETNQAISIYRKLAALEPKSPMPYLRMADAQFAAKQTDDAIENLRKALELDPDFLNAQQGLARVYVEQGRVKEAVAVAREVQKQRPKEPVGYALEGDIHAAQKNWAEAASAYRHGLKQSDSTHLAMRLHAVLGAGPGGASAASDFAATWLKTHPKDQAFRMQLAQAALATKQYAVAVQHYRNVLEAAPKNAIVLNNLAWAEAQINDPKALEHAEEANRIAPNQPPIMDTLGVLLVEKGQTARGLELLQKAVAQAPQAHGIRLNYAKALIKAGQKDAARKELDELTKLGDTFAGHAEVVQLRQSL